MNPDERAKWFTDGRFPTPLHPVSLNVVLSIAPAWRGGRFLEMTSRFGILEETNINLLKLFSGWNVHYTPEKSRLENMLVYEVSMPGFKLLTTTAPESYLDVARLQAKLIANNFNEAMLAKALNDANVDSIAEWDAVVDELTAKTNVYVSKYSTRLEPYLNAGIDDIATMARFIDEGIDVDLALAV